MLDKSAVIFTGVYVLVSGVKVLMDKAITVAMTEAVKQKLSK